MENMETKNTVPMEAEAPRDVEQTPQSGEKPEHTFTQNDVERIVKDRLARDRRTTEAHVAQREAELSEREAALSARESRFDCEQFLKGEGLSADLLDELDTTDAEAFKSKVGTLKRLFNPFDYPRVPDGGEVLAPVRPAAEGVRAAFKDSGHIPKNPKSYW